MDVNRSEVANAATRPRWRKRKDTVDDGRKRLTKMGACCIEGEVREQVQDVRVVYRGAMEVVWRCRGLGPGLSEQELGRAVMMSRLV